MKASDIKIETLDWNARLLSGDHETCQCDWEEVVDLPAAGEAKLTLPDGTVLLVTTSEWAFVYLQRTEDQ